MRSDPDRVQDILEAIERVERHTHSGRSAFDNDELIQVWVVRHLQIIGERPADCPRRRTINSPTCRGERSSACATSWCTYTSR